MRVLLVTEGQEDDSGGVFYRWFEDLSLREPCVGEGLWVGPPGSREKFVVAEVTFEEGRVPELQVDMESHPQKAPKEFVDLPPEDELLALGFVKDDPRES